MTVFNSRQDVKRFISDMPIDETQYEDIDCVLEAVTEDFIELMESMGWYYGDEAPYISDENFWNLFKTYEIEE